ncbi:MAG: hypothetical protein EOO45_28675, partial [Flavobacterium sp.]
MKSYLSIVFALFLSLQALSQDAEIINPKHSLFFTAEAGTNTITSFKLGENKTSLQGGIGAEYYFAKQWSTTIRVKYFATGLSYRSGGEFYRFEGKVISVPINIKWEHRIVKNLRGNLKLGIAFNKELESDYDYPEAYIGADKFFVSFNPGFGFNYFVNKNMGLYLNYEAFVLGNERGTNDWIGPIPPHATNNSQVNVGVK